MFSENARFNERRADANLHAHVANISEIFCTVITKVTFCFSVIYLLELDTQAACDTKGTYVLVQLGPEHEINLRGAPYELVPGYFVNSLLVLDRCDQQRLRRACASGNLISVSLLTNIKFEVDEDSDQLKF